MDFDADLGIIKRQEDVLQATSLSADMAWELCGLLRQEAQERGAAMTFEVQLGGHTLCIAATDGAPAGQLDWIRRKRNTVMRFARSSYALGLELEKSGRTLEERHGLTLADYAMHGGGFPLALRGTGCVGSVVSSGLHQRVDHAMVVRALAAVLKVEVEELPD